MRTTYILIIMIIIIGTLGNVSSQTFGNALPSYSNLSVPSEVQTGNTVPITVDVSDSSGTAIGFGDIELHYISVSSTIGNYEYTDKTIVLDIPRFTFSVQQNTSVKGFRIPIISISNTTVDTTWKLYRSYLGGTPSLYAQGDLFRYDIESQITEANSLFILPSTYQGVGHTNPSTFDLSPVYIYELVLDEGLSAKMYFEFPYAPNGLVEMTDDTSTVKKFIAIDLLSETISTYPVSGDGISTTWMPSTSGTTWIMSSYTAPYVFGPSTALKRIQVNDPSTSSISLYNATIGMGSSFELSAYFGNGEPVSGQTLEFFISIQNSFWSLGTNITDISGIAKLKSSLSLSQDTYQILVETYEGGNRISSNAYLTVTPPQLIFKNIEATQVYGDTQAVISGNIIEEGTGTPVDAAVVEIRRSGILLQSVLTNTSGGFKIFEQSSELPGTYNNYFELTTLKSSYSSNIQNVTLIVSKKEVKLTLAINGQGIQFIKFTEQPFTFSGTSNGRINGIELQRSVGTAWQTIRTLNINNSFSLLHNESVRDNYQYRLYFPGNATHTSSYSSLAYLYISEGDARITREGLNPLNYEMGTSTDPILVEYDKGEDIGVFILDVNGNPVVGATVVYYVPVDYTTSLITSQQNRTTDANGWVSLAFIPSRSLYTVANDGLANILVEAYHNDFIISAEVLNWRVSPTQIHISTTLPNPRYNEIGKIVISVVTDAGYSAEENTVLTVSLENTNYNLLLNGSGMTSLDYRFLNVGTIRLNIIYSSAINFPYYNTSKSFNITVLKGLITFYASDVVGNAGDMISITSFLEDTTGNPVEVNVELLDGTISLGSDLSISGIAQVNYNILHNIGIYQLTWNFAGNINYEAASKNITFTVNKIRTSLNIEFKTLVNYGTSNTLNITLSDAWNQKIIGEEIMVTLGSNTWLLTTTTNTQLTIPIDKFTGSDVLNVSYVGMNNYISSFSSMTVSYALNQLSLQFIDPINTTTYYNVPMIFSFKVTDITNQAFKNQVINITIGTNVYSYITDAQGMVYFNETLKLNSGSYDLSISANYLGYSFNEYQITLIHQKRSLDIESNLLENGSISEGQDVIIWLGVSESGKGISGVQVNISYGSEIMTLYTNSSGYIQYSINYNQLLSTFGSLQVGDSFSINIYFFHQNYDIPSKNYNFVILARNLNVVISNSSVIYNTPTTVGFSIIDNQSIGAANLYVRIEDGLGFSTLLQTDTNGYISFTYVSGKITSVNFTITIVNVEANLNITSFILNVEKATPEINIRQVDGVTPYLEITITSGGILLQADMELYGYDGATWTLLNTSNANSALFSVNSSLSQFKVIILGNAYILSSETIYTPLLLTPSLNVNNASIQLGENMNLMVTSNITFIGHLEIYTIVNESKFILGHVLVNSQSSINTSYLDIGIYTIYIEYRGGGWTLPSSTIFNLNVTQQLLRIDHNLTELNYGEINTFEVWISADGKGIENVSVVLEYYDKTWIEIQRSQTNSLGRVYFQFFADFEANNVSLRIRVLTNGGYASNSVEFSLIYMIPTYFSEVKVQHGTYTDGGNISAVLLSSNGDPIAGEIVYVVLNSPSGTNILVSALTQENGYVFLALPTNLSPNNYSIYLLYNGSTYYSSNSQLIDYKVEKEVVLISVISDIQSPENRTLILELRDNDGKLQYGFVNWIVFDKNYNQIATGSIEINGTGVITLSPLYGNYTLSLRFVNTNVFTSFSSTNLSFGWNLVDQILAQDESFVYPAETAEITVTILDTNGEVVNEAYVTYKFNGIVSSNYTDQNGILVIFLELSGLDQGNYTLQIFASNRPGLPNIETDLRISIRSGFMEIQIEINDYEYASAEPIEVFGIPEGSETYYRISLGNDVIYSGDHIPLKILNTLNVGNYQLNITILNLNYKSYEIISEFEVKPQQLNISADYKVIDGEIIISISTDLPPGTRLEVIYGSDILFTNSSTFSIPGSFDGIVEIRLVGNYIGYTQILVGTVSENSGTSIPFTEIMIITGISLLSIIEQKFKMTGKLFKKIKTLT